MAGSKRATTYNSDLLVAERSDSPRLVCCTATLLPTDELRQRFSPLSFGCNAQQFRMQGARWHPKYIMSDCFISCRSGSVAYLK